MTTTNVELRCEGHAFTLELTDAYAPMTVAAFLANLPLEVWLHGAKVAGNQFYWHAPFITPYEKTTDITTISAGAVVYFPERQFVEVIFGDLHPEVANINVIGRISDDADRLDALGRKIIFEGPRSVGNAFLSSSGAVAPSAGPDIPPSLEWLHAVRLSIWAQTPREISELLARRGLMLPLGPLIFADSEMRGLHEKLSRLWLRGDVSDIARIGAFAVDLAADRLEGHCGLHETAAFLRRVRNVLVEPETLQPALHELILHVSQFSSYLDQYLCWYDLNEAFISRTSGSLSG